MKLPVNIALIADEFTSFAFETLCHVNHVTPSNFNDVLHQNNPDILFIESAWHGHENTWFLIIQDSEPEIRVVIEAFKAKGIPTVFWNKEDPIHFDLFLPTALLCDYIFTTDVSLKPLYSFHAQHDRVYALPFAACPELHNPIEEEPRRAKASFAGTYYKNFPQRAKDLDAILEALAEEDVPIEIYDRHYNDDHPDYQFPEQYRGQIVGYLPFDKVNRAYKGYDASVNINTVKSSSTMMARRLFELAACNTMIISNYSRAIRSMFGELIISCDDPHELTRQISSMRSDELYRERLNAMLMRQVFSKHLYKHRMSRVLSLVRGQGLKMNGAHFFCCAHAETDDAVRRAIANFERQAYKSKSLHILVPEELLGRHTVEGVTLCVEQQVDAVMSHARKQSDYYVFISPDDYYGPSYLEEFAHLVDASPGNVLTKACFAKKAGESWFFSGSVRPYTYGAESAVPRRSAAPWSLLGAEGGLSLMRGRNFSTLPDNMLAIGRLQYCELGANLPENALAGLLDIEGLDVGRDIDILDTENDAYGDLNAQQQPELVGIFSITGAEMAAGIGLGNVSGYSRAMVQKGQSVQPTVKVSRRGECGSFSPDPDSAYFSGVATGEEEIFVFIKDMHVPLHGALRSSFYCRWEREETETGILQSRVVFRFLDRNKKIMQTTTRSAGRYMTVRIPGGAEFLQLGLRFRQRIDLSLKAIRFFAIPNLQSPPAPIADHLLAAPIYPSSAHLYRGGFLHSRVLGYKARGLRTEVFRLKPGGQLECSSFEGVDVIEADHSNLAKVLRTGGVKTLSLHFLEPSLWRTIEPYLKGVKVTVWLHGYEAQAAARRIDYFKTDDEKSAHQRACDHRLAFWKQVFSGAHPNVDFVFVSETFKKWVHSDVGCLPPAEQCHVIHNVIDTDFFAFTEKEPSCRYKILTIRPFSSPIYGNDLVVDTILKMSKSPDFAMFSFTIVGDGPDFDDCLGPIRRFSNVNIRQGFLTRKEIAALHHEHGIFLIPTRSDTQGVSRDEAMASGLVPVTNTVGAVPEFVDETSGILVPAEDADAMATCILELSRLPDKFLALSKAAAGRVRRQSSPTQTVEREIALICQV